MKGRSVALALLAVGLLAGSLAVSANPAHGAQLSSPAPYPAATVNFSGYGFGPGIGMGQWGAFGYAVSGEKYSWILGHYYGGTKLVGAKSGFGNPTVKVAVTENLGAPVVVTSPSGFRFGGHDVPGGAAARAVLSGARWTLAIGGSCGAKTWRKVGTGLKNPIAWPASASPTAPLGKLLTICRADGVHMTVRGTVQAYDNAVPGGGMRTLNLLPAEEYLADVVPSEVVASWGGFGPANGPQHHHWGFQALEAQAVAARTYLDYYKDVAGGWYGYADICDSWDCQTYPGVTNENPLSSAAVADTSGQVLEEAAKPALTQYSASTGGYTAKSAFPPVVDARDSICLKTAYDTCNPCHAWTGKAKASAVEQAFPSIGTLSALAVTKRNGLGQGGGRAVTVEVQGTKATVDVPAAEVEALIASPSYCSSDWFSITNSPKPSAIAGAGSLHLAPSPPARSRRAGAARWPGAPAGPGTSTRPPPAAPAAVAGPGTR